MENIDINSNIMQIAAKQLEKVGIKFKVQAAGSVSLPPGVRAETEAWWLDFDDKEFPKDLAAIGLGSTDPDAAALTEAAVKSYALYWLRLSFGLDLQADRAGFIAQSWTRPVDGGVFDIRFRMNIGEDRHPHLRAHLAEHLQQADRPSLGEIGDHAAEIMLLARIRKEAADARPEPSTAPTEPTAGWSELEKRWASGDR